MAVSFSYVHISDFHFCVEPLRRNAIGLINRNLWAALDTCRTQGKSLGLLSFAKPASYVRAIVSGVAQFCYERRRDVDGIIISGDLATTGLASDLNVAKTFVADPAKAAGFRSEAERPTLQAAKKDIFLLPGNHDRYASNLGATNSRTFDLIFERFLGRHDGVIGSWVRRRRECYIGFVFADFTLEERSHATNKLYAYGQGRVYEDVLQALKDRTLELRARYPGIGLNWILHFTPYDCGNRSLELIDWSSVAQSASALGVLTTLCGHTHQQTKIQTAGHTVYCAGSAGCIDSENSSTAHIIRYRHDEDGWRIARENFLWNSRRLCFDRQADD